MALPPIPAPTQKYMPFPDLPGASLHLPKGYTAPMNYKGRPIIAYHVRCMEQSCNFTTVKASRDSANAAAFEHRSKEVIDARTRYLITTKRLSSAQVAELLQKLADRHSHTYNAWLERVEGLIRAHCTAAFNTDDLPDYAYQRDYMLGVRAVDTAKNVIQEAYTF